MFLGISYLFIYSSYSRFQNFWIAMISNLKQFQFQNFGISNIIWKIFAIYEFLSILLIFLPVYPRMKGGVLYKCASFFQSLLISFSRTTGNKTSFPEFGLYGPVFKIFFSNNSCGIIKKIINKHTLQHFK